MSPEVRRPSTLADALDALAEGPWALIFGGQEALDLLDPPPHRALLLQEVAALHAVDDLDGALSLGTMTPCDTLARHPEPLLAPLLHALTQTPDAPLGARALNPDDPLHPLLLDLHAEVTLASALGLRTLPLAQLPAEPDELPLRLNLPRPDR